MTTSTSSTEQEPGASLQFVNEIMMGFYDRPKGFRGMIKSYFGASTHLWMWDRYSFKRELANAGFKEIRECFYGDSEDEMFTRVERKDRYHGAFGFEAIK